MQFWSKNGDFWYQKVPILSLKTSIYGPKLYKKVIFRATKISLGVYCGVFDPLNPKKMVPKLKNDDFREFWANRCFKGQFWSIFARFDHDFSLKSEFFDEKRSIGCLESNF